jgi:hypothetical protein
MAIEVTVKQKTSWLNAESEKILYSRTRTDGLFRLGFTIQSMPSLHQDEFLWATWVCFQSRHLIANEG